MPITRSLPGVTSEAAPIYRLKPLRNAPELAALSQFESLIVSLDQARPGDIVGVEMTLTRINEEEAVCHDIMALFLNDKGVIHAASMETIGRGLAPAQDGDVARAMPSGGLIVAQALLICDAIAPLNFEPLVNEMDDDWVISCPKNGYHMLVGLWVRDAMFIIDSIHKSHIEFPGDDEAAELSGGNRIWVKPADSAHKAVQTARCLRALRDHAIGRLFPNPGRRPAANRFDIALTPAPQKS